MKKITVFLAMRKGSQRVKQKNTKEFAGIQGGLAFIKISQLLKVERITNIIVSTDDEEVMDIAKSFNDQKIIIDRRPESLASSQTSTDDLIKYAGTLIKEGIVLTTYVTSPFVNSETYSLGIDLYFDNLEKYDSLVSVTKIQKFLWDHKGPINYDRTKEKWPRTQTIEPVYEINSGMFLIDIDLHNKLEDRLGERPFLYEFKSIESFDIDWEEDFDIAETLWEKYGKI